VNGALIDYCPYCGYRLSEKYVRPSVEEEYYTPWEIPVGEVPLGEPVQCILGADPIVLSIDLKESGADPTIIKEGLKRMAEQWKDHGTRIFSNEEVNTILVEMDKQVRDEIEKAKKADQIDYRGGLVSTSGIYPNYSPYYTRRVRTDKDIEEIMKDIYGGAGVGIELIECSDPQEVIEKFNKKYQEVVAGSIRRMSSPSGMMPNPAWEGEVASQKPACDLTTVNINVSMPQKYSEEVAENIAKEISKKMKRGMSR
jgi:hypothetical protein